jgi:hypothetical protein
MVPVIQLASSDAKNNAAFATSVGSPILANGNLSSKTFLACGSSRYGFIIPELIIPGFTQLHLMFFLAYSTAIDFVNIVIAAFVAEYAAR